MKYPIARGFLILALGAAGCAVGTSADVASEDLGALPSPDATALQLPDPDASTVAPLPDAAVDGADAAPSAHDAAVDAVVAPACAFSGELVRFDLATASGAQADLAPASTATTLGATVLRRGGVTTVSTNQAMNASDWPTGAVDLGKHFTFTVTPPAGCVLTVTSLSVDLKASSTGPKAAAVGSSVDGFGARVSVPITSAQVVVPLPGILHVASALELRVFGSAADASSGTLRLEGTLSVTGTVSAP